MKIAFFGTPKIAAIVLAKLTNSQFKPQLVITGHDKNLGRGQALKATPVKLEAKKANIKISYEISDLDSSFDVAILVAFGQIIPKNILAIPKLGFVNIHPSLLPKYRGPSPIHQAILNGDKTTGVTIIKLDEELDHGPILAQKELEIDTNDTHDSLAEKLANLGADLLINTLPQYVEGSLKLTKQEHSKAILTKKITKEDGRIDLQNPPSPEKLNRMVRAFYPWPTVWSKVKVKSGESKLIKFLPGDPPLMQIEGKRPMTIKEFLNGYPDTKEQIEKLI